MNKKQRKIQFCIFYNENIQILHPQSCTNNITANTIVNTKDIFSKIKRQIERQLILNHNLSDDSETNQILPQLESHSEVEVIEIRLQTPIQEINKKIYQNTFERFQHSPFIVQAIEYLPDKIILYKSKRQIQYEVKQLDYIQSYQFKQKKDFFHRGQIMENQQNQENSQNHLEQQAETYLDIEYKVKLLEREQEIQGLKQKIIELEKIIKNPTEYERIQKKCQELQKIKQEFMNAATYLMDKIEPMIKQMKISQEKTQKLVQYLKKSIENQGRKNYGQQNGDDFEDSNTLALDLIQEKNQEIQSLSKLVKDMYTLMKKLTAGLKYLKNSEFQEILREIVNIKI